MSTRRTVHFNPFVVFCVLFYFDFDLLSMVWEGSIVGGGVILLAEAVKDFCER
jgi:hypothetical protein